jgi:putative ABC transport system permease protein
VHGIQMSTQEAGEGLLVAFADPDFFKVFDLSFTSGDAETALALPNSLVVTRAAAEKYFPGESAIGQTITLEDNVPLTISAVIDEMPASTHFPFHFITPIENLREIFDGASFLDSWNSDQLYHYLLLNEGVDPEELDSLILDFTERHIPYEDWYFEIVTQRLQDIHFTPDLQNEMPLQDNIRNILKSPRNESDLLLFSAGALILVLIASFNFMNLQVARGFGRSKLLGLLKVVGASRYKIFERMLSESVLLAFLSLFVALVIVELSLGLFGKTIAVSLSWSDVMQPQVLAVVGALTLFLGLLSGAYPAWLMANQKPQLILKGEFSHGHGVQQIRQVLVLLQFTVSIILIAVSLGIYAQIKFSLSTPLGFNADRTAVVSIGRREVRGDYESLRVRILEHPDVSFVTRTSIVPTGNLSDGTSLDPDGGGPADAVAVRMVSVDFDYIEALEIGMAAGRSFHRDFGGDQFAFPDAENPITRSGIIINEAAARRAGWPDPADAIGKQMRNDFNAGGEDVSIIMNIVGVIKDVHYRSLRSEIVPMVFFLLPRASQMLVTTTNDNTDGVVAHIEQVWQETVPEIPLQLEWLGDSVSQLYDQETRVLNLMAYVSIIGMGVACLGLFAVASLVTEARRKEVALRKVFGASVMQIINLLSWKFLKVVILANLFAWPLAWLYMNDWLNGFVYRIDLSVLLFLIPGIVTLVVAWITVASQAWTVAKNHPIHALRYE